MDEEVQNLVRMLEEMHAKWKVLDSKSNLFEPLSLELLSGLRAVEWDLQDLEDTVSIVEGSRMQTQHDAREVLARKVFIEATRKQIVTIRKEVQDQSGEMGSLSTSKASDDDHVQPFTSGGKRACPASPSAVVQRRREAHENLEGSLGTLYRRACEVLSTTPSECLVTCFDSEDPKAALVALIRQRLPEDAQDPEPAQPSATSPVAVQPEAIHPNPESVHPNPEAVHPNPESVNPNPEAIHPNPEAIHPNPEAIHPNPEAVHPNPEAIHPNPEAIHSGMERCGEHGPADLPASYPACSELWHCLQELAQVSSLGELETIELARTRLREAVARHAGRGSQRQEARHATRTTRTASLASGQVDPVIHKKLCTPGGVTLTAEESRHCLLCCVEHGQAQSRHALGKRCVVVLGNTGAGKSAFINLLHGCTFELSADDTMVVSRASAVTELMTIGHTNRSETFAPQVTTTDCP
jgi:hypothetical protein